MEGSRIIELLTDILHELRQMKEEQRNTNARVDKLEQQQAKTNLALAELRTSVIALANKLEVLVDHERRPAKVEAAVFR